MLLSSSKFRVRDLKEKTIGNQKLRNQVEGPGNMVVCRVLIIVKIL